MSKTTKVSEEVRLALLSNGVDPDEEVVETALETVETGEAPAEVETDPELSAEPAKPAPAHADTQQLLELTRANAKLEVQIEDLKAQLDSHKGTAATAANVIRLATSRLSAVCGGTVIGLETADLSTLCNHFNQLNEKFEKTFPNRAVARPVGKSNEATGMDPEMTHRLRAVQKRNK
jgi:hypothetical protein